MLWPADSPVPFSMNWSGRVRHFPETPISLHFPDLSQSNGPQTMTAVARLGPQMALLGPLISWPQPPEISPCKSTVSAEVPRMMQGEGGFPAGSSGRGISQLLVPVHPVAMSGSSKSVRGAQDSEPGLCIHLGPSLFSSPEAIPMPSVIAVALNSDAFAVSESWGHPPQCRCGSLGQPRGSCRFQTDVMLPSMSPEPPLLPHR